MNIELDRVSMFGDNEEPFIDVIPPTGVYNDDTASSLSKGRPVCPSILRSAKLQLLWSDFGSETNPQAGVIAARVKYESAGSFFMVECERPVDCVAPGNRTFGFRIETAVEYYKVEGSSVEMFVPLPPRLVPPLPDDVFYPFTLKNVV
jgi:hypothetical protein